MPRIHGGERSALTAVAALTDCNPFVPERIELEQRILGPAFIPVGSVWRAAGDADVFDPNLPHLRECVEQIVGDAHRRLAAGSAPSSASVTDEYQRAVAYLLWLRYEDDWCGLIEEPRPARTANQKVGCYERFARDAVQLLAPLRQERVDPAHLFAVGFQARRAFHHIFRKIFGATAPAARLRASVWGSIFTRDSARYRRAFYGRMADIPTLITGESGTGKELVARAIALSQYIPFDASAQTFAADPNGGFAAVNLAALSPTLIESEMFGHRRGAFTGAIEDHAGWFERCSPHGAVFLDEIGELDTAIQVKLLRVLQSREFHRIGETEPRRFAGKVIAATHRDLAEAIGAGRFREDLYYRICADLIALPTLREQVAANADDLRTLIAIVARRVAGPEEAEWLADEAHRWVLTELGLEYPWPGNIRELEQCVRNILIRSDYHPRRWRPDLPDGADELAARLRRGTLSADELLQRYIEVVYAETGSLKETARLLGINWRTVRAKITAAAASNGNTP